MRSVNTAIRTIRARQLLRDATLVWPASDGNATPWRSLALRSKTICELKFKEDAQR
jgi:hypothetical protein